MSASTLSPLLVLVILVAYGVLLHVIGHCTVDDCSRCANPWCGAPKAVSFGSA
jgi:hypothetical protein